MKKLLKYFFAFFLFALSGIRPIYTLFEKANLNVTLLLISSLLILTSFVFYKRLKFTPQSKRSFYIFSVSFSIVTILQLTLKEFIPFGTIILYYATAIFPFLLISLFDDQTELILTLVRISVFLIRLSFLFWVPTVILAILGINIINFIPKSWLFKDASVDFYSHMVIYNFRSSIFKQGIVIRNCGPFWEPGAFAGIIIMSFVYFNSIKNYLREKVRKGYFTTFILGLISTFSTTGLLLIPFLLLLYFIEDFADKKKRFRIIIGSIAFLGLFLVFFFSNPLLSEKIANQMDDVGQKKTQYELTRMGNIIFMYKIVKDDLALGIGMNDEIFQKNVYNAYTGKGDYAFGNGMMDYIVKFGLIQFSVFLSLVFTNSKFLFLKEAVVPRIVILCILIFLLQGEIWLSTPFMLSFMFFTINLRVIVFNRHSEVKLA